MANTSNSSLTTDFNVTPYYDDFDETKNFYRILYRPGYAVQGRELIQMQTILQKQIDRFGKHIFKEGSIVLPGQFSIETDVDYVKIKDSDNSNNAVTVSNYLNKTLTGATNGITAYVIDVMPGSETETDTKTLYIRYQSSAASNSSIKTFAAGEVLTSNVGSVVALSSTPTGKGSRFIISEGVLFAKEHFVRFPTQSVVIGRYTAVPSARVGFNITETIIRYIDDSSLLDPALEASNYAAPGADRLKLMPELVSLPIDDTSEAPDFVELFKIQNGIVIDKYDRSQYNILRDEIAKRTSDESGDYYVNGLNVRIRENLDTGVNGGYSTTGNSSYLSVGVEPGTAYVKGYEVGKLVTEYVTAEKGLSYDAVNGQIATATMGNYIKVNEVAGMVTHDQENLVFLYDTFNKRLTNQLFAAGAPTGNVIGTARVQSIEYDTGLLGTTTGNVRMYLTDIKMNGSNAFSNTRSFYTTGFGADAVLDTANNASLKDTSLNTLLYYVGYNGVRKLRDTSGNPDMSFNFKRTAAVSIGAAGTLSLPVGTGDETFPYGTTSLGVDDKRDIFLTLGSDINVAMTGTVTGTAGTNLLVGDASTRFTRLNVGDKIQLQSFSNTFVVSAISNNSYLNVTTNLPSGVTAKSIFKAYKAGDLVDMTGIGVDAGTTRTISATPTQLNFDLKETFGGVGVSGTVTYQVNRSAAREAAKTLLPNRYVAINCASNITGTSGPFNLGIADVYQIKKVVRKTGSLPTSDTDGTDVTSSFVLNNGQKDSFYDHATITPQISLGSTDCLLVKLDYFEPSFTTGKGYFSVDSYPIDDASSSTPSDKIRTENIPIFISPIDKTQYDLRNFIDFRPVKSKTATDTTTIASATVNPAVSSGFNYDVNGLRLPVPASQFTYDYSYYLSRIDLVVMDKNGIISIIKGNPDKNPITPSVPGNVMALASLYVTPYPSIAPNYAQMIRRSDLACVPKKMTNIRFTMRDIGVLKNRIVNLEYYASLSLLEKSAIEMQIVDTNGLNRFKNGIFVDTFSDHSLGDTLNSNYKIVVDANEKSIRPIYNMTSIGYDYGSGTNVTKTGDLITLPYTNVPVITQNNVTSVRNVELSSYRFIGNIYMSPDTDVWVDTDYLEDEAISVGPTGNNIPQPTATTWNAWQSKVVGYTVDPANGLNNQYITFIDPAKLAGYSTTTAPATNYISTPNSPRDQKVTQIADVTRSGVQSSYSLQETVENLGNKLIDVSLISYIRPQTIKVNVKGVKALTKLYVFFDGEAMSSYVTPLTKAQYDAWPAVTGLSTEGSSLVSDSSGEVYMLLRLPQEKRFRVGTKEVVVSDSLTNSIPDASTYAKAYFVSQGLVTQKQNTILTTRKVVEEQKAVTETVRQTKVLGYIDNPSCTAYSFIPKSPDDEEGMFLTQVDIYLAAKHPTLGIWVEIREMDSAGGITRNAVPFSEVWIPASDLVVSSDASTPHKITFPSPVFVYNDTQYAFVIHTIGLNPDTYLWISRLGEVDIKTGAKVNSRPLRGTFYTTNNNLNWDIVQDVDPMITFYRASFSTGVAGQAIIQNRPVEKLVLGNVSSSLTRYGERFIGNYRMNLTGNTATIAVGDVLIGANSGANSAVANVNGTVFTVANTRYTTGERVNVFYGSNLVSKGISSVITSITSASGIISRYKVENGVIRAEIASSNGNFYVGDKITGVQSGATATVDGIDRIRYSVVDFEPSYLTFNKTSTAFEMQPTSNTAVVGTYARINDNDNYYYSDEKAILSKSQEVSLIGGSPSNNVRVSMTSSTTYLSPVLDIGRTHTVYVDSIINSNTTSETSGTASGGLFNKYISKSITLAEGQDAEDINVFITAYRPPTTDVKVYVKILHAEDSTSFEDAPWIELVKLDDTRYSSLSNRNDFKDYTFNFPTSSLTGPLGQVQYTNSKGIKYTGYKYFAVKIGLTGSNSAVIPRVADLRAIALQI